MENFCDVIEAWPKPSVPTMARDIAAPSETVKKWYQRGRIPSFWWPKVLEAAEEREISLTLEQLVTFSAESRKTG